MQQYYIKHVHLVQNVAAMLHRYRYAYQVTLTSILRFADEQTSGKVGNDRKT